MSAGKPDKATQIARAALNDGPPYYDYTDVQDAWEVEVAAKIRQYGEDEREAGRLEAYDRLALPGPSLNDHISTVDDLLSKISDLTSLLDEAGSFIALTHGFGWQHGGHRAKAIDLLTKIGNAVSKNKS